MSQIYKPSTSGITPSGFVETLTGNSGGAVGPNASDNINIQGDDTINIVGTPGSNLLTVSVNNSTVDTDQTTDDTPTTLSTIDCSTIGSYTLEARVAVFNVTTPDTAGFSLYAAVNSDGATATIISDTDAIAHKGQTFDGDTLGVDTINATFITSGTDVILQVTGLAVTTINWGAFTVYVYVGATI